MYRIASLIVLLTVIGTPLDAQAQDARSILETMQQKQLERWQGVDDYRIEMEVMGNRTSMYFQRTEVTDDAGEKSTLFLPISQNQRTTGSCSSGAVQMTPEALEAYAQGAEMTGAAMGEEIENGLEEAGLPRGLLAATGSSPTATLDPRVMMGSGATFARAAAEAQRQQAGEGERNIADAEKTAEQMAQFMNTARLLGTETLNGRSAYHLQSDSMPVQQIDNGEQYSVDVMSVWIDTEEYVPLQMKLDGTMTSGSETRPMIVETVMSDYRAVPNSSMYESYKQTMSISGAMSAEQEAQMREAAKQMEEYEKQMASVPASQRSMMENMMGPQLESMRQMSAGGGFRTEKVIHSIEVNPPMVAEDGTPCPNSASTQLVAEEMATQGASGATAQNMDEEMTAMIQRDLTTLGYDPGPVNGELTTATAIAISRFQAENDMEVTGAVSPQLAGLLAARASDLQSSGAAAKASTPAAPQDPAALKAAQQACLEEKMAAAQAAQKTKRGFGKLFSGIGKAASRFAGNDVASQVSKTSNDVYTANATTEDFAAAAKDLGLTEDDVAACQNPG